VLLRPEEFLSRDLGEAGCPPFENNSIERLRTMLVDVQPEDQLGEGSIALAKNLSNTRKPKNTPITQRNVGALVGPTITWFYE
jgi:hypothetical protein